MNCNSIQHITSLIITALSVSCVSRDKTPLNVAQKDILDCSNTGLCQELRDPPTLNARNRLINTQLSASLVSKCVNGKNVPLQSYIDRNAGIDNRAVGPAYILDVDSERPNPILDIQFTNQLADRNRAYDLSHHSDDIDLRTSLRTHGIHVSPKGSMDASQAQSDYLFLRISPATQTVKYRFDIPYYHAPRTHWHHTNLHGLTARQVKNGMAGALILKGEIDKRLEQDYGIFADTEKTMILQQISIDANDNPLCGKRRNGDDITTSINGQCLPVITVKAGDVQRWRFIHVGISATVNLAVEQADGSKQNLHDLARDGITMNGIQTQKNILLQPGSRSDLLLQFSDCKTQYPCELYLVDDGTEAASNLMGTVKPHNQIAEIILKKIKPPPMTMPPSGISENLYDFICNPAEFNECSDRLAKGKAWFANVSKDPSDPDSGTNKTVNGGVYPDTPTKQLKLNGSNTWKLWVGKVQSSTVSHPFHIHVNPFQPVDKKGFSYWKDSLLVSGSSNKGEKTH